MASDLFGSDTSTNLPPIVAKQEAPDVLDEEEDHDELGEGAESGTTCDNDHTSKQDPQPPANKRQRPNQIATKPRKKYVRGKQGSLKGLLHMPVDVFTQIMNLLDPADLVVLIRSGKYLRNFLLKRSSIQIWSHAERNVPGLPPCPPGMCEPQYAALMFSKHCTLCGGTATAKPDPFLWVRLCPTCRENHLTDIGDWHSRHSIVDRRLVHSSPSIKLKADESRSRGAEHTLYSLTAEVNEVLKKQQVFKDASDNSGLVKWEQERRDAVNARRDVDGTKISNFLNAVGKSRGKELGNMKRQRQAIILQRLKDLGWKDEDMWFHGEEEKPWRALVEAPKPLTDRIWSNILPKLIKLLEENRERRIAQKAAERQRQRRKRIDKFLEMLQRTENPLESILEALHIQAPTELDYFDEPFNPQNLIVEYRAPLPNTRFAVKWDCLVDLSEREITVEEVDTELEARKAQIIQGLADWRASVERRLVEKSEGGGNGGGNVSLTVGGSTEPAAHLSPDLRLLLRADTIFAEHEDFSDRFYSWSRMSKPQSYYYPNLVSSLQQSFERFNFGHDPRRDIEDQDFDLSEYRRHTEKEQLVKCLLADLGMPDVDHYIYEIEHWPRYGYQLPEGNLRHPPVYRNVHDIEAQGYSGRLVELVSQKKVGGPYMHFPSVDPSSCCLVCNAVGRHRSLGAERVTTHMLNAHDITDPVIGIHHAVDDRMVKNGKWHKKWDAFYDARAGRGSKKGKAPAV
ncbi:hypothetical protein FRC09_013412 [Ceratobasidium sp. 395]|nr:hypothetical protein FRC09_013412 [Ceratobasidium sp. 395]